MDYKFLLYSFLFAITGFVFYKIHKWWLSGRDENQTFSKYDTKMRTVKHWTNIIGFAIASVIYFFKFIG